MDYVPIEEARKAPGLRLVLTGGLPAPWSESAKGLFRVRKVDYLPVLQQGGGPNEELLAWTGHRNAPTALYEDEAVRVSALDMVNLAERLGSGPSLVPADLAERVQMFGLLNEIAGENGMAWNARILMFAAMIENMGKEAMADNPMLREYHYSEGEVANAPGKIIAVLDALSVQRQKQQASGSPYLIGDHLSALDIYWACFSQMLDTLPAEVNPMPDYMRKVWGLVTQSLQQAGYTLDPTLITHRDHIFENYLQMPLDF